MKKITFLFTLLITMGCVYAQDISIRQVPSVIINQFNIDFPKAKDIEWELVNKQYEVEFELGWNTDVEAVYQADGTCIKIKEDISKGDLPQAVSNTVKKEYPSYRIDDTDKITKGDEIYYKVEIEKRDTEITLLIDKKGNIIK